MRVGVWGRGAKSSPPAPIFLDDSRRTIIRRLAELEALGFLKREGTGAGSKYRTASLHEAKRW